VVPWCAIVAKISIRVIPFVTPVPTETKTKSVPFNLDRVVPRRIVAALVCEDVVLVSAVPQHVPPSRVHYVLDPLLVVRRSMVDLNRVMEALMDVVESEEQHPAIHEVALMSWSACKTGRCNLDCETTNHDDDILLRAKHEEVGYAEKALLLFPRNVLFGGGIGCMAIDDDEPWHHTFEDAMLAVVTFPILLAKYKFVPI
jgi:hypothetical protein